MKLTSPNVNNSKGTSARINYSVTNSDGVCVATLSVYPHRASLKNMPGHGRNRTYDLWNASHNHTIRLHWY